MVNWQVTATTIHCDAVDDFVTILVYKDGSTRCVGYHNKYGEPNITKQTAKLLKKKGKNLGRELRCEGPECHRVVEYKEKLFAEEAESKS